MRITYILPCIHIIPPKILQENGILGNINLFHQFLSTFSRLVSSRIYWLTHLIRS